MDTSAGKLTDMAFLENFTGKNPERMKKYMLIFLEVAPPEEKKMQGHLAEKNWEGIRAAAHSMRPQMTYMGIKSGSDLLSVIEKNCETLTGLDETPKLIEAFHALFISACEELKTHLQTINP